MIIILRLLEYPAARVRIRWSGGLGWDLKCCQVWCLPPRVHAMHAVQAAETMIFH